MLNPFHKGDRVKMSVIGINAGRGRFTSSRKGMIDWETRRGVVDAEPRYLTLVRVLWDDNKYPATYHVDLITHVEK